LSKNQRAEPEGSFILFNLDSPKPKGGILVQPRNRATGATLWGVPFRIERNSAGVAYE
jgi:hypothetical protein